jgi:predicted nucleic acid-binding protein
VNAYVLDASVVVKWFIPEAHSESALKLKEGDARFHAPAFLTLEIRNVLAKKRRRNELTHEEAEDIWRAFWRTPIRRYVDETLALAAFDLAQYTRSSLEDNLYLALGIERDIPFVTADRKSDQTLRATPYRRLVSWIEDL